MLEKQIIEYMRYVHGAFNMAVALIILYQGWVGLGIRKGRLGGLPDFRAIRRHRSVGPYLVTAGIAGFMAGLVLVYVDQGRVFQFPLHMIFGALIACSLAVTYVISRKIRAGAPWRLPHFLLGLWLVCLYIVQVLLGLSVLF